MRLEALLYTAMALETRESNKLLGELSKTSIET